MESTLCIQCLGTGSRGERYVLGEVSSRKGTEFSLEGADGDHQVHSVEWQETGR